ncbi:helix-turn-helix transcriptional regulator [Maridesulfovibrio ferrireducens]|uniref:ArsR/SmtB family transcription factor n=1 Tax=Maridesulfovibrio ferrireducens TaxID=246191 RepID=UPI001A23E86E|nr:metalloregulator ArsR/SmtB family transcription factor [Maridesulfovibrio ferrireducens]MBI9110900.1 winged helix-turn-helix transcriptional regulator [Maridesulfovibrio ferrireducens]
MKEIKDTCDGHNPDPAAIEIVRSKICSSQTMEDVAATFKILGEPVRISILHALSIQELCVCDLAELLNMSHSAISHQLRILRSARMVRFTKQGRKALYRLDDSHVETIIQTTLAHLKNEGCTPDRKNK